MVSKLAIIHKLDNAFDTFKELEKLLEADRHYPRLPDGKQAEAFGRVKTIRKRINSLYDIIGN